MLVYVTQKITYVIQVVVKILFFKILWQYFVEAHMHSLIELKMPYIG